MSKIKNMKLRYKIGVGVATAGALAGVAGGAFAYWTAAGSGTGSATTGSSSPMTLIQDTTLSSTQLVPGVAAQTIMGHQYNAAGTTEYVGAVTPSITAVTETPAAIALWGDPNYATDAGKPQGSAGTYYCSTADYTLVPSSDAGDETVGPNATQATSSSNDFSLGTIVFKDLSGNQDACKGASLTLSFSS